MLRRSPRHRLRSAVLALWFALFSAAPSSWRPCPEHGLGGEAGHGAAAAAHGAHAALAPAMTDECAEMMAAAPASPAPPHGNAPSHPATHPCDCPPSCGVAPSVARVEQAPAPLECVVRVVESAAPAYVERAAPERPRLLPFANGPPGKPSA